MAMGRWMLMVMTAVALAGLAARPCHAQSGAGAPGIAWEAVGAAEVAGGDAEGTAAAQGLSWQEAVRNGGFLMYVLAALSVLTVALITYFVVVLRVSQIAPWPLRRELVEYLRSGRAEEARTACESRPSPFSAVVLAAMDYLRDVPKADRESLRDVIEGEGGRQAESIQGQTQYLLDIAVVAPMIGLLGTVFGMLRAFGSVARDIASAKPVVLAEGVSQALVTTAFGLIVGIPAMMFYAYFRRRAAKQISHLEAASTDILTALMSKR